MFRWKKLASSREELHGRKESGPAVESVIPADLSTEIRSIEICFFQCFVNGFVMLRCSPETLGKHVLESGK